MKIDLSKLATLKEMVRTADNFSDPLNYFFDHFGDHTEFIDLGERVREPFVEAVIEQVGNQLFPSGARVRDLFLTRLEEHGFIHGGFLLNGCLGNVLYFEELRLGLMAVCTSVAPSETKIMRFSGKPMPNNWLRSEN